MTSQRFNKTIERKKEIIKAAMQLFSEKGYAQTSMRDIARTMGVSLGLCYRYFDSKQILFNTAIDLYIEECCNSYLAILHDSTITIKDKIDALFTSIGDEHSNMQYYDFFHRVENEELHEQLSIKLCKYMYPHLLEAVKKAIAAKEIYIENPEALISFIIYGQVGLLSKSNIEQLKAKNYEYILGARIRTSDSKLSQEILSLNLNEDNSIGKIKTTDNDNLIVSYTPKRAKKDEYNRTKGLKRLEKKVKSGKLTKDQINSRGYNKYLHLKNEINVEIDYEKFYQDSYWDGLKGYITNTNLSNDAVISNYSNLWQIEKAFRMSKSDLEIRPIYHFTRRRIEAHISISFVAYSIYKELERLLYLYNAPFSVKKAREIIHNIYQIEVTLPDSGVKQKVLLQMDEEQQFLVNMIQNEISKSFG